MTKFLPIVLVVMAFYSCSKNTDKEVPAINVVPLNPPSEYVFMGKLQFRVDVTDNEVLDEVQISLLDSASVNSFYVPVIDQKFSSIGSASFTKSYEFNIMVSVKQTMRLTVIALDKGGNRSVHTSTYRINQ